MGKKKKRPPFEGLLAKVRKKGTDKGDRTGVGTISMFGNKDTVISYNLAKGFPLITTKRVPFRLIAEELLWFLKGDSNIRSLLEKNVHIWSEWPFVNYLKAIKQEVPVTGSPEWDEKLAAFEKQVLDDEAFAKQYGDLGPVYGVQWVSWPTPNGETINQIERAIETIKTNPNSRRILVSAWNPADLAKMALEPCHAFFQFYVSDGKLSCQMYQRSADLFLGVPFNIASYALLTHMIAQQCDLDVGTFTWVGGDTHIYKNHFDQVDEQLSRKPRRLPTIELLNKPVSIFDYRLEDFKIEGYDPHLGIKAPIAV